MSHPGYRVILHRQTRKNRQLHIPEVQIIYLDQAPVSGESSTKHNFALMRKNMTKEGRRYGQVRIRTPSDARRRPVSGDDFQYRHYFRDNTPLIFLHLRSIYGSVYAGGFYD